MLKWIKETKKTIKSNADVYRARLTPDWGFLILMVAFSLASASVLTALVLSSFGMLDPIWGFTLLVTGAALGVPSVGVLRELTHR